MVQVMELVIALIIWVVAVLGLVVWTVRVWLDRSCDEDDIR